MNLNQVTVPVLDLRKSIDFYQLLGLKLIVHSHNGYARFECNPGGSTFSLHKVDKISEGARTIVYFEREDLDALVVRLVSKGIKFEHFPKDQSWLWRESKLYDPDNNPIIIYWAGENRLNPPWRLK